MNGGLFLKKRTLFRVAVCVLAAVMVLGCIPVSAAQTDGTWYDEAVRYVTARGLMNGVGGGEFAPDASVSRAMAVTVLWRMAGAPETATAKRFSDVAAGTWYFDAVAWAAENRVVGGYPDGTFAPDAAVTREELAVILRNFVRLTQETVSNGDALARFSDRDAVSDFAREALSWCVQDGLLAGSGAKLNPRGVTTRAQLAEILMRLDKQIGSEEAETPSAPQPVNPAPVNPDPVDPTPKPEPAERSRTLYEMTVLDAENAYAQTDGRTRRLITQTDDANYVSTLQDGGMESAILSSGTAQVLFRFVRENGTDISDYQDDGVLYLKLYNGTQETTSCTLEIGSLASNDKEELQWSGISLAPGWNVITLPLSKAAAVGGTCNLESLVRLRIFATKSVTGDYILGDVSVYHEAYLPGNTTGNDADDVACAAAAVRAGMERDFPDGEIPMEYQRGSTETEIAARLEAEMDEYLSAWLKDVENTFSVAVESRYTGSGSIRVTFRQGSAQRTLTIPLRLMSYDAMQAQAVTTEYTNETIVADIVVGEGSYPVDKTGAEDATETIQRALDNCAWQGGGTVWLPAGYYRITGMLEIPAFVTLRGDYQDPDTVSDPAQLRYGTILLADVESSEKPLVYIGGSAGVLGLTVYYPHQSLTAVRTDSYTFYNEGQAIRKADRGLHTVENCTVINAYRGVGLCDTIFDADAANSKGEQTYIQNVKGSFLETGMYLYNAADNGGTAGFTANGSYWAQFTQSAAYAALPDDMKGERVTAADVAAYTKENGVGLRLGDLEGDYFSDVSLDSYRYGIQVKRGARTTYYGDLYGLTITNCTTGAEFGALSGFGVNIACSTFRDNDTDVVNNTNYAVKLAAVECQTISGSGARYVYRTSDSGLAKISAVPQRRAASGTVRVMDALDTSGKTDVSAQLQAALDALGASGGVVYLPAGHYRLESGVNVPAGVELRGSSPVGVKPAIGVNGGTVLETYFDYGADSAMVTLSGANAGVSGLMMVYPKQENPTEQYAQTGFAVRAENAPGAFVQNCSILAASHGIRLTNCDGYTVMGVMFANYENNITASGCAGGQIFRCLQNATPLGRNGFDYPGWDTAISTSSPYFTTTSAKLDCIILDGSTGQTIAHWYAYRPHDTLTLKNGASASCVNMGAGGASDAEQTGTLYVADDTASRILGVNTHQKNRFSVRAPQGADIKAYNRMTLIGATLLEREGTYRNPGADDYTWLDGTDTLYCAKVTESGYDLSGGGSVSCVADKCAEYADVYDFSGYAALALDINSVSTEGGAVSVSLNGKTLSYDVPGNGEQTLYLKLADFGDTAECRIATFSVTVENTVSSCILHRVRAVAALPSGKSYAQAATGQKSKKIVIPGSGTLTGAAVVSAETLPEGAVCVETISGTGSVWQTALSGVMTLGFDAVDLTRYADDGYVHLRLYVPESAVKTVFRLELSSSGKRDSQELQYEFGKGDSFYDIALEAGWNELYFPIRGGWSTGFIDLSAVNFLAVYQQTNKVSGQTFYLDGVEILHRDALPEGVVSNGEPVSIWTDPDTLIKKSMGGTWKKADLAAEEKYGARSGYGIANTLTIAKDGAIVPAAFQLPSKLHLANYSGGYLHLSLFVEDDATLEKLGTFSFELTSSGASDSRELQWNITNSGSKLKTGWNELYLPLTRSNDSERSGWCDLNQINFFRLFFTGCKAGTFKLTLADMYVTASLPAQAEGESRIVLP